MLLLPFSINVVLRKVFIYWSRLYHDKKIKSEFGDHTVKHKFGFLPVQNVYEKSWNTLTSTTADQNEMLKS